GEGNTNYWDGPVASGDTFEDGYGGLPPGLTLVSCQAKDVRGALSPWSPPCTLYLRALAAPEWRADVRSLDGVCPAVAADGTIYVTSYDGVYAVNPDGTVRWLSPARCYRSVAIAPDGTLRFVQRAGDTLPEALRALDPDGSDRWSFVLPRSVESDLAVGADGTTYFGCQDSFLYAVDSAGRLRWRTRMTARWFASIVLGADGTAYVETPDRTAAVGSDGVIEWTCQVGCRLENVVMGVGPDGTVYCGEESLTAIRPDGTVAWTQPTGSTAGTAVGPDGTIYQPSQLGLLAFDRDGSLLWTFIPANYDFDRYISGLAIVSDGTIYCSSRCGGLFLHAVDAAGRETWRGQMAGGEWWPTNPAVGPNGFVYIAGNGPLHAFRGTAPLAGSGWPKYQRDMSNSGRSGGP
ncbi:PQQ-like beta-propeller repeat protein, partial [candidate division WOR-3 bacterium]|nr:PQQ-like beta-propeller repeat protein [candidate division WOR-3 bacterium]